MKTFKRALVFFIFSGALVIFFHVLFLYMTVSGMDDGGIYVKSDFIKYYIYTDKDISDAPEISGEYYFEYHPGDGYPSSNSIVFSNATNAEPLKEYLTSKGYDFRKNRVTKDILIWESLCTMEQSSSFYIQVNYAEHQVQLEKKVCY